MSTNKIGKAAQAVSLEEARLALGISKTLVYRMAASGKLPTVRLGKRILVPVEALEEMLKVRRPAAPGGGE